MPETLLVTTPDTALVLPSEDQFKKDLAAINRFQKIAHANMIPNQDYGVIPGTSKPTLLKPGAEKIAKLLGLADSYAILDRQEDWSKPFFRYLIKCSLTSIKAGVLVSEGLGECNSMEGKYRYRWVKDKDVPGGVELMTLPKRWVKTGRGSFPLYRIDNDDIYSLVNTLLKMSKKRALVDAALSAGRLSNVFTQDIEDMSALVVQEDQEGEPQDEPKAEATGSPIMFASWLEKCPEHNVEWFTGQYGKAHKLPDGTYCNLKKLVKPKVADIAKQAGLGEAEFKVMVKDTYSTTWSGLSDEQVVALASSLMAKVRMSVEP